MKKFEAMDRVQQLVSNRTDAAGLACAAGESDGAGPASRDAEEEGMTMQQLEEVFKQTSVLSLRAMQDRHGARSLLLMPSSSLSDAAGTDGLLGEDDDAFLSEDDELYGLAQTTRPR